MPSYRQIHTKIWKDGWFLDLPPDYKLLFIYLFSNERANLTGLYDLPLKVMCFETDLDADTVTSGLQRFAQEGKAFYEDGWVWVRSLLTYNALNLTSQKIQTHIKTALAAIPDIPLKARLLRHYQDKIPYLYPIDTISIPDPTEQEKEQEHEQEHDPEQEKDLEQEKAPAIAATPATPSQSMFTALAGSYRIDARNGIITDKQRGRLNSMCGRLLKGGYSVDEVSTAGGHWWREDWRGKKGSAPTDSQFLETLANLRQETGQAVREASW